METKKTLLIISFALLASVLLLNGCAHHRSYAKGGSHTVNKERNK
jgi:hypothetical protein